MGAVRSLVVFWVVSAVGVASATSAHAAAEEPAAATAPAEPDTEPSVAPPVEPAPAPPEAPPTEESPPPAETAPAPAAEAPTPEPPVVTAAPPEAIAVSSEPPALGRIVETQALVDTSASPRARRFGMALDAGMSGMLPDVGVLFVYRPLTWMRAAAGAAHNLVRPGVKASLSLVNPLWLPLSLTGEAGHFFEGNVNDALRRFAGQDTNLAVLERVSYRYANALLGLELGSRRTTFYLRAGVTTMRMNLKNFDQVVKDAVKNDRARSSEPRLSYRGPTVKLGLVVYF
jgi:hypothetical protein